MAKAKQLHFKGQEPVVNKAIESLADEYDEAKNARMGMLKVEVELKGKLIEAMKKHKLTAYERGEYDIKLEPGKDKVKVRIGKDEEDDEGEQD